MSLYGTGTGKIKTPDSTESGVLAVVGSQQLSHVPVPEVIRTAAIALRNTDNMISTNHGHHKNP